MQKHRIRCCLTWAVVWLTLSCADLTFGWASQGGSARGTGMGNAFTAVADDPYESDETSVGDHHVSITIYPRMLKAKEKAPPGRAPSWADQTWNPPDFERDVCTPGNRQKLGTSVHAREIHIGKEKFVLFLVELDADASVAEWKLHIYPGDAGNVGEDPAGLQPLRTLQGWAMPANSILWDLRADGNKVPGGTYCCCLEISGPGGDSRSSGLTQFRVR